MKVLVRVLGSIKIGIKFLLNHKVNAVDYSNEYNKVAATYHIWQRRMGNHTKNVLKLEYCSLNAKEAIILDLACGTGYLCGCLVERYPLIQFPGLKITGVDISGGMLAQAREAVPDKRVTFVEAEGLAFLKKLPAESYDAIFCGWGLVYFDHRKLLPELKRVLKPRGIIGVIMNARGTLVDIENIFIDIMLEHPGIINKIMDIRFYLPKGENNFKNWFGKAGFTPLETGNGEEVIGFTKPEELYRWLSETGAIAGINTIFSTLAQEKDRIIAEVRKRRYQEGRYTVNHKYVYGIFRKDE